MLSDGPGLAACFQSRWDVTNSFLHKFPFIDILNPPAKLKSEFEFVIASDVFEHVPPPYQRAIDGTAHLVRAGGFAVISVPTSPIEKTEEHYPNLIDYSIEEGPSVTWTDSSGNTHFDQTPEMHGGDGLVLAFRQFSSDDIKQAIRAHGFDNVYDIPFFPEFGVFPIENPGVFICRK